MFPLRRLLDRLLPRKCQICGGNLAENDPAICRNCFTNFPFIFSRAAANGAAEIPIDLPDGEFSAQRYCNQCGTPMPPAFAAERCLTCLLAPLQLNQLRSLTWYEGTAETAIKALKYGRRWMIAGDLGRMLGAGIKTGDWEAGRFFLPPFSDPAWDLITAVPSPIATLRQRGFSQTHLIGKALSRSLGIPIDFDLLFSRSGRASQAGLSPQARQENVVTAFELNPKLVLLNCRMLLLDDVITTGATVEACARLLYNSGAARVDVLTVARSPNFTKHRLKLRRRHKTTLRRSTSIFPDGRAIGQTPVFTLRRWRDQAKDCNTLIQSEIFNFRK